MCRRRASAARLTVHAIWSVCFPRFSVWYVPMSPGEPSPARICPPATVRTKVDGQRVRRGRQVAPHLFAYEDCNFKVQKSKESTARVVVFREFNLVNSFTLEASFAGPSMGDDEGFHYGSQRLQDMGVAFCQGLLEYCDPDPVRPSRLAMGRSTGESRRESAAWKKSI
jgi:hypothetical protein